MSEFLLERDGYKSDPGDIFLTNGASDGVRLCMQTVMRDPSTGITLLYFESIYECLLIETSFLYQGCNFDL